MSKPLRTAIGSIYADFGFTSAELFACTMCGTTGAYSLLGQSVPITRLCPVAGLVGVCASCVHHFDRNIFAGREYCAGWDVQNFKKWTPPRLLRPIKAFPAYVILRGFCDDERLAECFRHVIGRIPEDARKALTKHWSLPEEEDDGFSKGALRIEALPSWPERTRTLFGHCLNAGHAIRLHSATVSAMTDAVLECLVAHESAHCYQYAVIRDPTEEDAIAIMREWGFADEDIHEWYAGWFAEQDDRRYQARKKKQAHELAALKKASRSASPKIASGAS